MNGQEIVFALKADFLKALAHPLRLAIIEHLKNGEKSVGQLVKALESPKATFECKQWSCRMLRQIGTEASVPALAKLLQIGLLFGWTFTVSRLIVFSHRAG